VDDAVSKNCKDGKHRSCWGCACPEGCHAVPPTADFRAAREALARKREQRESSDQEATA
jgi:hypothetical protein